MALGELMEQELAVFSGLIGGEDVAAELAEILQPGSEVRGKLFVDFAAQALRERGTFAGGGDGDLQIAASDYRAEVEVAVRRVVDRVAEDVAGYGFFINGRVYSGVIGCGYYQKYFVEIGGLEIALMEFNMALLGECGDVGMNARRDDAQFCLGAQQ